MNLSDADLRSAALRDADLVGASLVDTILMGTNLRGAEMTCAGWEFDPETGEETGTHCVKLQGTLLVGADLRNAKMRDAVLRYAI
ncbi:pentapeptide repeat-containing protein [Streptomyces flavidovirens]|uniref:pentapeptide repeat-containing protein n=1 Tax=Streptomyces flavidovirens TaxID=67298 RepID=UPI00367AEC40